MTEPNYQGTASEYAKYGATLTIWQQLALLQAWSPLIGYGQRLVIETDPYRKSLIIAEACEWLASKTQTQFDDQAIKLVADILKSSQGQALVVWCLAKVEANT